MIATISFSARHSNGVLAILKGRNRRAKVNRNVAEPPSE
jgi:hypothetical protein